MIPPEQDVAEKIDVRDEVADFYPLLAVPSADRAANVESRLGSAWECGGVRVPFWKGSELALWPRIWLLLPAELAIEV